MCHKSSDNTLRSMRVVLLGIVSIMVTTTARTVNIRPECVAAKMAVVNRDTSFLESRPELFVGSAGTCNLDLAEVVSGGDAFAEALLGLDASLVNGSTSELTPMDYAIFTLNVTAVAWLADRGVALNQIDWAGGGPLHYAVGVFENGEAVVKVLLSKGADANLQTAQKRTALMTAIYYGRNAAFQLLLPLSNLALTDYRGYTALFYAVENNSPKMVRLLLEAGADVHVQSTSGLTVFMAAKTAHASLSVLAALVEAGADVDACAPVLTNSQK